MGGLTVAANYNSTGFGELTVMNLTVLRWRYFLGNGNDGVVADEVMFHTRKSVGVVEERL